MARVWFDGVQLDERTRDMFVRLRWKLGIPLVLTQGSYSTGVSASAGTHAGGGALDIRARDLTSADRYRVVLGARQLGFAAWLRTPAQSDWPYHIHAVAIGCPDLHPSARDQVIDYWAGRNGLAGNGPDDGPDGYRSMTWEKYEAAHPDEEWEMSVGNQILAETKAVKAEVAELKAEVAALAQAEAGRYNVATGRYADLKKSIVLALDEAEKAEDESVAGPRYSALQETVNSIRAAVDAIPKA